MTATADRLETIQRHAGSFNVVKVKARDADGHSFATRLGNALSLSRSGEYLLAWGLEPSLVIMIVFCSMHDTSCTHRDRLHGRATPGRATCYTTPDRVTPS